MNEKDSEFDVFISYRWVLPDMEWVRYCLVPGLRAAGLRVCIDIEDFVPGRNLILEMARTGSASKKVLCVLSPEYFESGRMVYFESLSALGDDPVGLDGPHLIPLMIRWTDRPAWLRNLVTVDWTKGADLKSQWRRLLVALGVHLSGVNAIAALDAVPKPVPERLFPAHLPRLDSFFGRSEELAFIAKAIAVDARTWGVHISGHGGIGKTALAIRAAQLAPLRFKRIVFVSAKETELTAEGVEERAEFTVLHGYLEVLNAIAREINLEGFAQGLELDRTYRVRRELEKTTVLLVLDNLDALPRKDQGECFAFLSDLPSGCSAIVTSRRGRGGASGLALRLGRLDEADAQKLIDKLAEEHTPLRGATVPQRQALYTETGGNPLLIRWVVGQLVRGACLTIEAALKSLANNQPPNDPLEFIFHRLLENSTDREAQVLAILSHYVGAMEVGLIAGVLKVGVDVVDTALSTLASRSLVLPDSDERRWSLAPLVAGFLRRKRPDLAEEMGRRLEDHAFRLIMENGGLNHQRYGVLAAAWPIVAAALPLFLASTNGRLQRVCDALHVFLEFEGHWDEWLSLNEQAEAKAKTDGDFYEAGWRALQAGRVHRLRRQPRSVFGCVDRATEHWSQTDRADPREHGDAQALLGKAYSLQENYPEAIKCFETALQTLRPLYRESRDYTSALNGLADAKRHSWQLDEAEALYNEALDIARAIKSPIDIAAYTGNLAALAIDRKRFGDAEKLAWRALDLAKAVGRQESIADDYRRLSEAFAGQGMQDKADKYAKNAEEIYARLGLPYDQKAQSMLKEPANLT